MGDVINSKRPSEPESNAASSPLWVIEIDDDPKNKQTKKTDKNKRETHLDEDQVGEVVQVDEGLEHLLVQRRLLAEVVADRRLAQSLPSAIPKKNPKKPKSIKNESGFHSVLMGFTGRPSL